MVDQVVAQLRHARVQRAPGVAGAGRWVGIVGQGIEQVKGGAVVGVFGAHHADGVHHKRVAAGFEHGKQDGFFLVHVLGQLVLHGFQKRAQAGGHARLVPVHALHPVRHADQFGKLGAVHIVVAADDVVDQRARLGGGGGAVGALQRRQFGQHGIGRKAPGLRRLGQAQVAAAAKVQFQAAKHGRGAGQLHCQLANRLGGIQGLQGALGLRKAGIHEGFL